LLGCDSRLSAMLTIGFLELKIILDLFISPPPLFALLYMLPERAADMFIDIFKLLKTEASPYLSLSKIIFLGD
jgi:hypothetical protein